ncbi:hypothetical protein P7C70_g5012, partial [Phenoliferia sp. Uapishka_3]
MSSSRGGSSPSKSHTIPDKSDLFKTVKFFINDSIPPQTIAKLSALLTSKGGIASAPPTNGRRFNPNDITHFITDTLDFPEYEEIVQRAENAELREQGFKPIEIVTPLWATKSYDVQALQGTRYFSADKALYFSGLTFCTSELPDTDAAAIQAGVTSLGGQWRYELTKEVTHLFVVAPDGPKYVSAITHGVNFGMVVLLPHWFEECLKLRQLVPIDTYQFPEPPLLDLHEHAATKSYEERVADYFKKKNTVANKAPVLPTMTSSILGVKPGYNCILGDRQRVSEIYQRTAAVHLEKPSSADLSTTNGGSVSSKAASVPTPIDLALCEAQIFAQRIIYLASDLGLRSGLEEAIKKRVEDAGGECWSWGVDGMKANEESDQWERRRRAEKALERANTVVTRSREGWEYWSAFVQEKTIGNLPWMYHVLATSKLDAPLDHLLHYPLPRGPVSGFENMTITISNYSGPARDYVRTMIESLGGQFDGAMSKKTDVVITASEFGQKVKHAKQWGIPIVSHAWLENCISDWTHINPGSAEAFSARSNPNTNFMTILGNTPLRKEAVMRWASLPGSVEAREAALVSLEEHAREEREEIEEEDEGELVEMEIQGRGEAFEEAEDVMMDVDEEFEDVGREGLKEDVQMRLGDEEEEDDFEEESVIPAKSNGKGKEKEKGIEPKKKKDVVASKPKEKDVKMKPVDALKKKFKPVEMDEDDDDDPNDTPALVRKSTSTIKKKPIKPVSESDDDSDAVLVRSPPKASTSKPLASAPNGKPHPTALSSLTALSRHSSSESSSEPERTPPQRIDFQNKIPVTGKRAAAGLAAKRLAEQMPDANKFAQELKHSGKKRRKSSQSQVRQRSAAEESDEEEGDEEDEGEREREELKRKAGKSKEKEQPPKKKAVTAPKKSALKNVVGRSAAAGDTQEAGAVSSFDNPPHAPPPKKLAKARVGSKKVRIIMTGLNVDTDSSVYANWVAKLGKLGAKFTDEPKEVTHLVVKGISRTEKFLCSALAFAPFIVTRKWIEESIAANTLLDEEEYLLKDLAKERELGFTLAEIVGRAKSGKLFQDYTFYLTPGILPNVGTIRKVIDSNTPKMTKVSLAGIDRVPATAKAFVVSCPKDRSRWDKYASKNRGSVYSVEAVFQSVIHQELRFTDNRIDLQTDR